ncbi:MAG: ATP synthase subunit delta [Chitinophagales bacterium]|nr:MAG: ATP synthase subunit delta [Chitinophagales bacterium]
MSAVKLATRYAKSLLDLAIEQGKADEVYQDQLYLKEVIRASREFNLLLSNPIIHPDKKIKALQSVLKGKISDLTMSFLTLLVKKSREVFLKEMVESFLRQYDAYKHITPVKVISAAPLDKQLVDRLLTRLKQQAQLEEIRLETAVDSTVIGGFILQYGDKKYDASIARALNLARKRMDDNAYLKKLR